MSNKIPILFVTFVLVCLAACTPEIVERAPIETEVIKDDMTAMADSCELLAVHTFNECRDSIWHIVTKAYYDCHGIQYQADVHVIRTNQYCDESQPVPGVFAFLHSGVPESCQAPVRLFTFYSLACPDNTFWNWLAYDMWQCADGRLYIERVPSFDRQTQIPCTEQAPVNPVGN